MKSKTTRGDNRPTRQAVAALLPAAILVLLSLLGPLAAPASAGLYHPKAPFASFGPLGGSCAAGSLATATGDLTAASGSGDFTEGSNQITNLTTTEGAFAVGMKLAGTPYIEFTNNATITAVSPTTLTLSESSAFTGAGALLAAGFTEVTNFNPTCGTFAVGQEITGPGILKQTKVVALGPGTLTLSKPPTKPGSGVALAAISRFGQSGNNSLAFQQQTERLYLVRRSLEVEGIYGFDLSTPLAYSPLAAFSPLLTPTLLTSPTIAVDNSTGPSAGNIYTLSQGGKSILAYRADGSELGGFPIPSPNGEARWEALAVDPSGNLWAADTTYVLHEFSPAGVPLETLDLSQSPAVTTFAIQSLDFDAAGDLYLDSGAGVWKLPAPSYEEPVEVTPLSGPTISVDRSSGDLYLATEHQIYRFDAAGNLLEQFPEPPLAKGPKGGQSPQFTGIAIDEASKAVYAYQTETDEQRGAQVFVFQALTLPDLALTPPSGFSATAVTLNGTVHPDGLALTGCEFEYVTEAAYEASGFEDLSSGGKAGCSPTFGSIPTSGTTPVSATITGLDPGVHYRYRLAASNENGTNTTKGAPGSFALAQPDVETVGSPIRTATTARLDSRLDPHGLPTTYHFEYLTDAAYQANLAASEPPFEGATQTPSHPAGSGALVELVSQSVEGLSPDTTYRYRLVADNGAFGGPAVGEERTLTTRSAEEEHLSHGSYPGPPGSDRAWEQVNLPDTSGNPVAGAAGSASDGNSALYRVTGGTSVSETGTFFDYLYARRPPGEHPTEGWQTVSVFPSRSEATFSTWFPPNGDDQLTTLLGLNLNLEAGGAAAVWRIPTDGEAPAKLYQAPPGKYDAGPYVFSDDGSRALLLLKGTGLDKSHAAPGGLEQLYDVSSGEPHMASLLPGAGPTDPGPACGSKKSQEAFGFPVNGQNGGVDRTTHWVSADGRLAFFPTAGNTPCGSIHLYMRDFAANSGAGESYRLDPAPLAGPECSSALIRTTSEAAYFWTQSDLTAPDTPIAGGCGLSNLTRGGDVYRFDLQSHQLACLTCVLAGRAADVLINSGGGEGAAHSIGIASAGHRLYFTSAARLLPGAPEADSPAVYRLNTEAGSLAYVAPLRVGDTVGENPSGFGGFEASAISSDGRYFAFRSASPALDQLSGSDNGHTPQDYLYDDTERSLLCASCPADGSAPRAAALNGIIEGAETSPNMTSLADDGTLAFATPTALVGADQNTAPAAANPSGGEDVYEFRDGRALLVSDGITDWPGEGSTAPKVATISPSGRDIFFTEAAPLTPDALDGYTRLYDARVGGGIDFPEVSKPCALEVCQGTPKGAPEEQAPGTSDFRGPGNETSPAPNCRKPKVRRKGRCVAKHPKRAKHAHHQAAKHNRGAQR